MEVLRLGKQMTVGHANPSYWTLHRTMVKETGGFVSAFYRGFMPWGLMQCLKGIPVLFVQSEAMHQLQRRGGWNKDAAEKASGFLGGASQALFVTPMQKIKVSVVACETINKLSPLQVTQQIVKQHGILSLYDGVVPMILRRSIDWGIRFTVSNETKNFMIRHKQHESSGDCESDLALHELMICGMIGGSFSALTHPIDNIITNAMKPLPDGVPRDMVSVSRRMFMESGMKGFIRGWGIRIVDNSYHMAWMYGIGTYTYDLLRNAIEKY
mmetsp:Transcript_20793/g.30778  ORF Transcript_20793/g.30778 Transcript_20793/m.30778 type:complete len:269 (-) Transcript_20793:100-906(-)